MFYLAFKAVNETAGPLGLFKTLLKFGIPPSVLFYSQKLLDQAAVILHGAGKLMKFISHKVRINTAMRSNITAFANLLYDIGDNLLTYRLKPFAK